MTRRYKNTLRDRVSSRILQLDSDVILWTDLQDLSGSRQISRVLKEFIDDGVLVRIGRGIYAKTRSSKYIDGPMINGGFEDVCLEALNRLNIRWELGSQIKDYNEGKTQQVPAQLQIRLKDRFRRHFSFGNNRIRFEGEINAR